MHNDAMYPPPKPPRRPSGHTVQVKALLGKKSNYVIRFFETWGRNPVFQFSIRHFEDGSAIWGQNDTSDEIDRVSTSDNSTPSGAN